MGNAPSLGNIKTEQLGKLFCTLACHGVAPGSKFTKLIVVFVKNQIAVHHSGYSDCGDFGNASIITAKILKGGFKANLHLV